MAECDEGVALLLGDYGPAATTLVRVDGLGVVSSLIDADGDGATLEVDRYSFDEHDEWISMAGGGVHDWRGTSTCDTVLTWGEATHDSTILVRYVRGDGLEEILVPRQREPD